MIGIGNSISIPRGIRELPTHIFDDNMITWINSNRSDVTKTGNDLERINDLSGNSADFTATAGNEPQHGVDTLNGKPVMTFDGVADFLETVLAKSFYNFLHNGGDGTIITVVKPGNTNNPDALFPLVSFSPLSSSNVGYNLFYDDRSSVPANNRLNNTIYNGTVTRPVTNPSSDDAITPNAFGYIVNSVDANNATASERSIVQVNNGAEIKNNTDTGTPSAADSTTLLRIGIAGTFFFLGQIAEIIVLNSRITEAQKTELDAYIQREWGL